MRTVSDKRAKKNAITKIVLLLNYTEFHIKWQILQTNGYHFITMQEKIKKKKIKGK